MFILCFKDTTKFSNFKIFNDKSFTEITNKKQICYFGKNKNFFKTCIRLLSLYFVIKWYYIYIRVVESKSYFLNLALLKGLERGLRPTCIRKYICIFFNYNAN